MVGPRTTYPYDVFLSHSSADKLVVRELAKGLRAAGLRVWFDEWIIKPGDPISVKIEEGLEHSGVLLFCMSANAFGSEWAGLERHAAIFRDPQNLERRFIPLRLDDAKPKAMLRIFAEVDWRPGADREREWARLLEACRVENAGEGIGGEVGEPAEGTKTETAATDSTATESPRAAESTDATSSLPPPPAAQPPSSPASPSPSAVDRAPPSLDHLGAPQPPRTLDLFHPGAVWSVGWSPDGQRLASGGNDGTTPWSSVGGLRRCCPLVVACVAACRARRSGNTPAEP
ncbi:MAG: TIR domain-containing protein, partial [Cyanobium sp.]